MRAQRVLLGAAALLLAGGPASGQQRIDERRPAAPGGEVRIEGHVASVRVSGWARGELSVTGTLAPAHRLEITEAGGATVVRVVMGQRVRDEPESRLVVRVPAGAPTRVSTLSGGVAVEGVDGAVTAESVSGGVSVSGGRSGEIVASSRSGEVVVAARGERVRATSVSGGVVVSGSARQAVEASSTSGRVRVTAATGSVSATSVSGTIEVTALRGRAALRSVNGGIRLSGPELLGSVQTVSGEVVVNGEPGRAGGMSLTTHSGDVALQLPRSSSAAVEFTSVRGRLDSQFPGARVTGSSPRSQRLVVGGGASPIRIRTFSGSARLSAQGASAAARPAAAPAAASR